MPEHDEHSLGRVVLAVAAALMIVAMVIAVAALYLHARNVTKSLERSINPATALVRLQENV